MAYTFTKDLETGNPLIDSEHRQLIDAVNNLLAACSTGKGRAELANTAKFLQDYTAKHFGDEEKLQLQNQYPDYVNHRRYHEEFKKKWWQESVLSWTRTVRPSPLLVRSTAPLGAG